MSTKLYDGLRLKDSTADIFELVPLVAYAIAGAYGEAAIELMATELVDYLDGIPDFSGRDPQSLPIYDLQDSWRKHQQELGSHHALNDPLRFSIVFGRAQSGTLLAYPFYRESRYRDALESLEIFEDYHYQNQSDRPDEISSAQWGQRRKDWDSVLDGRGTLGSLPSWQLSESDRPFSQLYSSSARTVDANSFSSPESRLSHILRRSLFGYAMEEINPAQDRVFPLLNHCHRIVAEFLATEEGSSLKAPKRIPQGLLFGYGDFTPYEVDSELIVELFGRV